MRSLPLVFAALLAPSVAAQEPGAHTPPTAVMRTDAERALVRALLDLQKATAQVCEQDHAFRGTWRRRPGNSPDPSHFVDYQGATAGPLQLLQIDGHTVVTAGERLRVWRQGDWRRPDGDAPECPMTPRGLLTHLVDAEITAATAVTLDDRPAQRVYATWRPKTAAALLDALSAPHGDAQKWIENLATAAERMPDSALVVDAVLHYDPAQKRLLTATVRVAVLTQMAPERFEPPPSPAGFPSLTSPAMLTMEYEITIIDAATLTWPSIDDTIRAELLPPKSAKAPVVTPK